MMSVAQVRGKDIPKPVKNWNQCGISSRVLDVLKKGGLTAPMPIQARPSLAPVLQSGTTVLLAPADVMRVIAHSALLREQSNQASGACCAAGSGAAGGDVGPGLHRRRQDGVRQDPRLRAAHAAPHQGESRC